MEDKKLLYNLINIQLLVGCFLSNNFAIVILTALWANIVRTFQFPAIWAFHVRIRLQSMVRTAHIATRF